MYINRLIEFADTHEEKLAPLGFKYKKINWIVDIEQDGFIFNQVKQTFLVPDASRSSNTKPFLIVDKPDYIFGFSESEKDKARSAERHKAYKALLDHYLSGTEDKDVKKLRQLLENPVVQEPKLKIGDFIIFRMRNDEFLHEAPTVKTFWEAYVQPQSDQNAVVFPCMFCHQDRPVMDRHTIDFLIGPDRTKMITANKNAYESHGLKNSQTAPTCYVCEQKYGKTLEFMLERYKDKNKSGGPHMFRLGDITYVYWLREKKQLDDLFRLCLHPLENQTAKDMSDLLKQAFRGVTTDRDTNNFCLLALSSNKGRLVVRDYMEDSAGKIKDRIEAFFQAQKKGNNRFYSIYALASTMYVEPRKQMQKYALEEWMKWFLYGRALSGRILIHVLKRIQAIGNMYAPQAAAVKSWLTSQKGEEWMVDNTVNSETQAFKIGRAFAVLERIQYAANNNTTLAAKYFGSASTTPKSIMGLLIRNAQHHLAKVRNDEKTKGKAINMEKDLRTILAELNEFPAVLSLEKQGEFALGYYTEQQKFYGKAKGEEAK